MHVSLFVVTAALIACAAIFYASKYLYVALHLDRVATFHRLRKVISYLHSYCPSVNNAIFLSNLSLSMLQLVELSGPQCTLDGIFRPVFSCEKETHIVRYRTNEQKVIIEGSSFQWISFLLIKFLLYLWNCHNAIVLFYAWGRNRRTGDHHPYPRSFHLVVFVLAASLWVVSWTEVPWNFRTILQYSQLGAAVPLFMRFLEKRPLSVEIQYSDTMIHLISFWDFLQCLYQSNVVAGFLIYRNASSLTLFLRKLVDFIDGNKTREEEPIQNDYLSLFRKERSINKELRSQLHSLLRLNVANERLIDNSGAPSQNSIPLRFCFRAHKPMPTTQTIIKDDNLPSSNKPQPLRAKHSGIKQAKLRKSTSGRETHSSPEAKENRVLSPSICLQPPGLKLPHEVEQSKTRNHVVEPETHDPLGSAAQKVVESVHSGSAQNPRESTDPISPTPTPGTSSGIEQQPTKRVGVNTCLTCSNNDTARQHSLNTISDCPPGVDRCKTDPVCDQSQTKATSNDAPNDAVSKSTHSKVSNPTSNVDSLSPHSSPTIPAARESYSRPNSSTSRSPEINKESRTGPVNQSDSLPDPTHADSFKKNEKGSESNDTGPATELADQRSQPHSDPKTKDIDNSDSTQPPVNVSNKSQSHPSHKPSNYSRSSPSSESQVFQPKLPNEEMKHSDDSHSSGFPDISQNSTDPGSEHPNNCNAQGIQNNSALPSHSESLMRNSEHSDLKNSDSNSKLSNHTEQLNMKQEADNADEVYFHDNYPVNQKLKIDLNCSSVTNISPIQPLYDQPQTTATSDNAPNNDVSKLTQSKVGNLTPTVDSLSTHSLPTIPTANGLSIPRNSNPFHRSSPTPVSQIPPSKLTTNGLQSPIRPNSSTSRSPEVNKKNPTGPATQSEPRILLDTQSDSAPDSTHPVSLQRDEKGSKSNDTGPVAEPADQSSQLQSDFETKDVGPTNSGCKPSRQENSNPHLIDPSIVDRHHDSATGLDNARSNSEATPGSLPSPSRSKPARYGSSSGIPAPALHSPTSVLDSPTPALHLPTPALHSPTPALHSPTPALNSPTPALRSDSRHSTLPANNLTPYRPSQIPSSTCTPRSSSSSPSRSLFRITMRKETPQSRSLRKRAPNRNNENSHSLNVSPSNSSIAAQSALSSSRSKSYSSRSPVLQSPTPRTTTTTRQGQTPRSVAGDRGHYDTENESSSSPYAVANSESAKNGAKAALHTSRSRQSLRSPTKQSCSSAAPVQLSTLRTTDPSHNQTLWSRSGNTGHHGAQNVASGPLSTSPNLTNQYIASVTAPSAFQPPDSSPYQSGLTKGSSTSRGTFTKPMGENYSKPDEPKEKNKFSAFMSSTSLGIKTRIIEPLNETGDSLSRIFIDPLRRNKNRK